MTELHDLLDEMARDGEPRGATNVFDAAAVQATTRRRVRRRVRFGSAGVLIVALVFLIGSIVWANGSGDRRGVRVENGTVPPASGPGPTGAQLAAGHWDEIPAPPFSVGNPAIVWTGTEILVWGKNMTLPDSSQSPFRDAGGAYNPRTKTWRRLPGIPLEGAESGTAVWTGTEMIVITGSQSLTGAAYDSATNHWRVLPVGPTVRSSGPPSGVWTGDRAIFFAGPDVVAYDPAKNRWKILPPPTSETRPFELAVAAGPGRVVAWYVTETKAETAQNTLNRSGIGLTRAFRYDEPTGRWTTMATDPGAISLPEEAFWTGSRLLVRSDLHLPGAAGPGPLPEVSAWFDVETGAVTRLPADALTADNVPAGHFSSAWTGRALWSFNAEGQTGPIAPGDASAYDATTNTWSRLPRAPFGCGTPEPAVWTGTTIVDLCFDPYPGQSARHGGLEFVPGPPGASLPSVFTVSGTFRMVGGPAPGLARPIAGTIVANAASGKQYSASAGNDGKYTLRVPAGTYDIFGRAGQLSHCGPGPTKVAGDTQLDLQCDVP